MVDLGILGQVWYLIVSIPDLCILTYLVTCKNEEAPIKNEGTRVVTTVLHYQSIFMPPKELWEAYSNRTVRQSVRPCVRPASCPVHISYIL